MNGLLTEFAKNDVQPKLYTYGELRAATNDFHPDMKLGEGAFGVVYKVTPIIMWPIKLFKASLVDMSCQCV